MFDKAQMEHLAELISVTVAATVHQQQATAASTAVSPAGTRRAKATTPSPNNGPVLKVELRKSSGEEAD